MSYSYTSDVHEVRKTTARPHHKANSTGGRIHIKLLYLYSSQSNSRQ